MLSILAYGVVVQILGYQLLRQNFKEFTLIESSNRSKILSAMHDVMQYYKLVGDCWIVCNIINVVILDK